MRVCDYGIKDVAVREIGVAVFKARLICHSEFNDQDIDDDLLITDAWLRDAEGWRAVTGHASPVPKLEIRGSANSATHTICSGFS